jgi:glycosyltransferase involved in cell wall biosynthesis
MSVKKIGIIEPVGGHGGMNYYDYGLGCGLNKAGLEVHLYTSPQTTTQFNEQVNTHLFYEGVWGDRNKVSRLFAYFKASKKAFIHAKSQGIEVLHFHFFDVRILEYFDLKTSKKRGFKNVVTIHDIETFQEHSKRMFSLDRLDKYIDKYIVHNQSSLKALTTKFPITIGKVEVIKHGNYEQYVGNASLLPIRIPIPNENAFTLLFFGQIKEVKGLDILLEALAICKQRNLNVQLIIAGKVWQSDFSKYQTLIEKHQLESMISLNIKYIPDEEVATYFAASDLIVLPYKRIYQSGVLLMTMSYGKPVLVSDLEAMKETINDGVNGFTFENENSDSLASKIEYAMNNSDLLFDVARQSKKDIIEKFDWADIGLETAKLYSEL